MELHIMKRKIDKRMSNNCNMSRRKKPLEDVQQTWNVRTDEMNSITSEKKGLNKH